MNIYRALTGLSFPRGLCCTIGNFDGVHLGHQALVKSGLDQAARQGLDFALLTFWPHPRTVLKTASEHVPLTSREERFRLLEEIGVENILEIPFTSEFAAISAEEFVSGWLKPLNLRHLAVGHDFSLGHKREGSFELLKQLGSAGQFQISRLDPVLFDNEPVSSTRVRHEISQGNAQKASRLLGRPYSIHGVVAHGFGRGGGLGFPTANLSEIEELLPGNGVYAGFADTEAQASIPAVINIGFNPTFNGQKLSVESFLLDASVNLYGQRLRLRFLDRLRQERKFANAEELIAQINRDVASARQICKNAPLQPA